jgi:hypothetical protein
MRTVVIGVLRESARTSHSLVSDAADDVTPLPGQPVDHLKWRVKHRHTVSADQYRGCIEILELHRFRAPGRLTLIFAPGPGRDVGGYPGASGVIFLDGAGWLMFEKVAVRRSAAGT